MRRSFSYSLDLTPSLFDLDRTLTPAPCLTLTLTLTLTGLQRSQPLTLVRGAANPNHHHGPIAPTLSLTPIRHPNRDPRLTRDPNQRPELATPS